MNIGDVRRNLSHCYIEVSVEVLVGAEAVDDDVVFLVNL